MALVLSLATRISFGREMRARRPPIISSGRERNERDSRVQFFSAVRIVVQLFDSAGGGLRRAPRALGTKFLFGAPAQPAAVNISFLVMSFGSFVISSGLSATFRFQRSDRPPFPGRKPTKNPTAGVRPILDFSSVAAR